MQKDRALKSMAVISAILSGISVLSGCMCVIFPKLYMPVFYGYDLDSYSLGSAMPFMLIKALLPFSFFVLALVNAMSENMEYKKGLITAVLNVLFYLISSIISGLLYSVSLRICAYSGGTDMVALLSGVNTSLGFINWLNYFAVLLLISTASIEIYASKKNENQ